MEHQKTLQRVFAGLGLATIGVGLAANEWMAGWLNPAAPFDCGGRFALGAVEVLLVLLGVFILWRRRELGHAFANGLFTDVERSARRILAFGIVLRVAVFLFLGPFNNDPHMQVIQYIVDHGVPPTSEKLVLAFQPPLYYLMAVPWAVVGSAKVVQLFSLLLSLVNFVLLYLLIRRTPLLRDERVRCHALLLTALLPQFVVFSNFVSNDVLAYLMGTLIYVQAFRYIGEPTRRNLLLLGVVQGVGLLTKGTFLAFLPVLLTVVVVMGLRPCWKPSRLLMNVAMFASVAALVGCYKYVENTVHLGQPIADNDLLQQEWIFNQAGMYRGPESLVDINVAKLVRDPFVSEQTNHSVPLVFYATFWHSYIQESSFTATRAYPLTAVPRAIYVLGLVPVLLMLVGAMAWLWRSRRPLSILRGPDDLFRTRLCEAVTVVALLGHFALILSWGLKHDAYSFFQSRLVFPAFFAFPMLLGWGWEALAGSRPRLRRVLEPLLVANYLLWVIYFAAELSRAVAERLLC